ncbi:hypothetical protein TREMEDRAFT_25550 [Tremella mesenterica DSM 1558]|uniref:uncharacterized protein n=1 Tax=Tremella mesenterica (strain ATCC 24925 / CBS 8224 / DSM 1558 / NBRC 9311 / NRRL Y-6157 / RJB 2259-6 / UBC 559-6) TaxID=578456 RepID=UPI0003F49A73|nr:uncharacterized protein TREMEDRAFT_25550 [Tremella mesenterica DSM 1558]EIW73416.1 hypothetical protein TREMEDRAFT_25550 [Tremella mesenterica DSM 1558]
MRFRTTITHISLLRKIVQSLGAIAKICVVRLTPEKVYFIVPGNEGRDGVQVWSQVKVETLFQSYRIESHNNNEIWVEIHLEAFLKVLKSAPEINDSSRPNHDAFTHSEINLKLNKRDTQALWAFEIRNTTAAGREMSIIQDVKVVVLSVKRQNELNEPLCPPPEVHVVLPKLVELRNIIHRLGHITDDVTVSGNRDGKLELRGRGRNADLTITWKELQIPALPDDTDDRPIDEMIDVTVSIRGMLKFLTSHQVGGEAIACEGLCRRHCLIVYVYIGEMIESGGVLTFFIPAKNVDDD